MTIDFFGTKKKSQKSFFSNVKEEAHLSQKSEFKKYCIKFSLISLILILLSMNQLVFAVIDNADIEGPENVNQRSEELYIVRVEPLPQLRTVMVEVYGPFGKDGPITKLADYKDLMIYENSDHVQFFHTFNPTIYAQGETYTFQLSGSGLIARKSVKINEEVSYNKNYEPVITFNTNQENYQIGDVLKISGRVNNFDTNTPMVSIVIQRPDGKSFSLANVIIDSNGEFLSNTSIGDIYTISGNYKISVTHQFQNLVSKSVKPETVSSEKFIELNVEPSISPIIPADTLTKNSANTPSQITDLKAEPMDDYVVNLSWSEPDDNGLPISWYYIQARDLGMGTDWITVDRITDTDYEFTHVRSSDLRFRVAAENSAGISDYSYEVTVTTFDFPPRVIGLNLVTTNVGIIDISWSEVKSNENVITYILERHNDEFDKWESLIMTSETMYSDREINPGNTYHYRVRALNEDGYGEFSRIEKIIASSPSQSQFEDIPNQFNESQTVPSITENLSNIVPIIVTLILVLILVLMIAVIIKKRKKNYTPPEPPNFIGVSVDQSNNRIIFDFDEPKYWGNGRPNKYVIYSQNQSQSWNIYAEINYVSGHIKREFFEKNLGSYQNTAFIVVAISLTSRNAVLQSKNSKLQYFVLQQISYYQNQSSYTQNQSSYAQNQSSYTQNQPRYAQNPQTLNVNKRISRVAHQQPMINKMSQMMSGNISKKMPANIHYQKAIQNPQSCFLDLKFSKSVPVPTATGKGLPYSVEGSFAIVFKLTDGLQEYAVKCFTSPPHGFQNQEKLVTFFHKNNLDFVIDYDPDIMISVEMDDGIVGIYPTLISSWIKGDTLLKFLEKSSEMKMLPSQTKLLAKKFREIAEKMESLKMAHGDLSGKNIMIEQGYKIKLIDYDGVYIPEFKNQPPKESGTRHYQHKSRLDGTINFYDESMDRFSIMLIYLSLMAISHNPQLFAKYHDDDNIIFKQSDLENPNGSEVFKELFKIPNEEIKYLTRKFQDYCKLGDPRKITKLELSIPKAQSGI